MKRSYQLTAARKRALHRAQLISARKRKGRGKRVSRNTKIAAASVAGVSAAVLLGSAAYGRHKVSGSSMYGASPRGVTPMINVVGVEVPGTTRAGLRIARYNRREGFAVNYTHRNKHGDRTIFSYRHIPLTREALRATMGKKVSQAQNVTVTHHIPSPEHHDPAAYAQANAIALTQEGRGRRAGLSRLASARKQLQKKGIPTNEVYRRVLEYEKLMKKNGVEINPSHRSMVWKMIAGEGF